MDESGKLSDAKLKNIIKKLKLMSNLLIEHYAHTGSVAVKDAGLASYRAAISLDTVTSREANEEI